MVLFVGDCCALADRAGHRSICCWRGRENRVMPQNNLDLNLKFSEILRMGITNWKISIFSSIPFRFPDVFAVFWFFSRSSYWSMAKH